MSIAPEGGAGGLQLRVIAMLGDEPTTELLRQVTAATGDELVIAPDLAEGLARVAERLPHIVLIDVAMGENAGLAVVHHVQALVPGVLVYALLRKESLQLSEQALSLGSAGLLLLPLSGDELLMTLSDVRTRMAEREQRRRLERAHLAAEEARGLVAAIGEIAAVQTRRSAAVDLVKLVVAQSSAVGAAVHIVSGDRSRQLVRAAMAGDIAEGPAFCEEMDLLKFAADAKLFVARLSVGTVHQGFLTLHGGTVQESPLWELFVAQATTALALIGEREQSQRGAMKDPHSSAYTFAYFVDVAGREIDKAVRHSRRFALATVTLTGAGDAQSSSNIELADRLLGAVRDTDIVARIDETEFYLLLPETGGIGAHSCRRRIMQQLNGIDDGNKILMGLATFPHDGRDLSQLLRVAKYRSDASESSLAQRSELWSMPLRELLDAVLWDLGSESSAAEAPRAIELPVRDVLAVAGSAVQQALRAGATWLLASQKSGLCVGTAARAAISRDRDTPRVENVDLTGVAGCDDLEVLALVTQHGAYTLFGRSNGDTMRAVHSADPLFADLVVDRLSDALGTRFVY